MKIVSDQKWTALHEIIDQQQKLIELLRREDGVPEKLPRLFHGTTRDKLKSILASGLNPALDLKSTGTGWLGTWKFVSNLVCRRTARDGSEPVIFEVHADPASIKEMRVTPSFNQFLIGEQYMFETVIPPDCLVEVPSRYLRDGVKRYRDRWRGSQFELYAPFEIQAPLLQLEEPPKDAVERFEREGYAEWVRYCQAKIDGFRKWIELLERTKRSA